MIMKLAVVSAQRASKTAVSGWALVSAISVYIHSFPLKADYLSNKEIARIARIERVKQSSSLWRSIGLAVVIAYLGLLIPWITGLWTWASQFVTDPKEIIMLGLWSVIQVALLSLYFIVGVGMEIFKKVSEIDDLLLRIPATK